MAAPKAEMAGVVLGTAVAGLWVFALAQWSLAEVFQAPGATWAYWPFWLAIAATVGCVAIPRSKFLHKRKRT